MSLPYTLPLFAESLDTIPEQYHRQYEPGPDPDDDGYRTHTPEKNAAAYDAESPDSRVAPLVKGPRRQGHVLRWILDNDHWNWKRRQGEIASGHLLMYSPAQADELYGPAALTPEPPTTQE